MTHACSSTLMGLHHITWRATASAVANVEVVAQAMAWLIGDMNDVELDKSTSYHGPELTMVKASTINKRLALRSFARLGEDNLQVLAEEFPVRMDEQRVLHFRLSLDSVIRGQPELALATDAGTVKGQAKFEVYSGLSEDEQLQRTLEEALNLVHQLEG